LCLVYTSLTATTYAKIDVDISKKVVGSACCVATLNYAVDDRYIPIFAYNSRHRNSDIRWT